MLKIKGRVIIIVDDVDIEQAGIETGLITDRERALHAAKNDPDMMGIFRLCERTSNPITLKSARPAAGGNWTIIFMIGKPE